MSVKTLKAITRTVHLAGAVLLIIFLSTSRLEDDAWVNLIRFAVLPALSVSGLLLWQAPRVVRLTRRAA